MTSESSSPSPSPSFPFDFIENSLIIDFDIILSVILRTVIITTFVFLVIRWMHHKGTGQLSMHELIIIIGLGSAIGEPMIYIQELTVTQAFTAIIIVVALFKLIDYLTIRSKRFEKFVEEDPTLLVKDGKYIEEGFKNARITKGEFQAHMRTNGIKDISEVEESYLEITGQISFIKKEKHQESIQY
ncbi:MAG TPA: YetF domain-containing protein [Nitrososphaera sp.]|nr:YetF domain-containing protein [Nitrososphaera sp.]